MNLYKFLYKSIALLSLASSVILAQEKSGQSYSIMSQKELSDQVVAEVGPIKITVNEFINNYEFGPAFIKRMKDSKKHHLDFMIYEKLLALEGYNNKIDTLQDVQLFLKDIQGDLAGEKLYRSLIWDKINVSEQEISRAVEKENTTLTIKWIYSKNSDEIFKIYDQLGRGEKFDTLFVRQFSDSVLYEDRFLETDRFNIERKNPELASIIDSVSPGHYSMPIKTADGWYIVKVENITKNTLSTESGYNDQRYKIESALKKEKADSASDVMIREMFSQENPVIIRTSFNSIAYYLGEKYLQPFQVAEWHLEENIKPAFFNNSKFDLIAGLNDTLVRMSSEPVTINTFINWYSTREPYLKLLLTSKTDFLNSVQGLIWRMLRDHLITRMADTQKYYEDMEIESEMKWWKDKVVYSKLKQVLASSINMSEDKIHQYYLKNKSGYSDSSGSVIEFTDVKDRVRNDYYVYEYTKKMVNKVLSLKNKYSIKINKDLLDYIPVSEENNPRSINLYSVKKGGTFVRPVYPAIDNEWQFWN